MLSDEMHDGLFQHRGGQPPAREVLLATVLDEAPGDVVAEPLPVFLFGVARRQPVPGLVEELACQWGGGCTALRRASPWFGSPCLPWCITLDNSKGISRLRFWAKNSRVNGINDLPVFVHQGNPHRAPPFVLAFAPRP